MIHKRFLPRIYTAVGCVLLLLGGFFWSVSALGDDYGGSASGEIVARSETTIDVQGEHDNQPTRYLLPVDLMHDPASLAFIKKLAVGDQVQLTWVPFRGHRLVTNIKSTPSASNTGPAIVGVVTDMAITPGKMIWIEIKDDAGKSERYSPCWEGHGLDKEMTAAITRRNVGDRVEIHSTKDDHVRVTTMRVLALAPEGSRKSGFEGGKIVGRVTAKDTSSITIKPDADPEEQFAAQPITGTENELDPSVIKAIAGASIGQRVEGEWYGDGQKRLISLQRAGSAKPASKPATNDD